MRNYKIKNLYFARVPNLRFLHSERYFDILACFFNVLFINNNIPYYVTDTSIVEPSFPAIDILKVNPLFIGLIIF